MDIEGREGEKCLFANRDFKESEKVLDIFFSELATQSEVPDKYTIELSPKVHLMHPVGRYINHSCSPSMRFDKSDGAFYAKYDIEKGEELTFNYLENETTIQSPFKCGCNSSNCVEIVN